MRRLVSIAAFALVLTLPVWAQHGGGMHGGGMHGGGFAGRGGGSIGGARLGGSSFGGSHSGGMHSSGMRSGSGFSHGFNRSFNQGSTHGSFQNHGWNHSHNPGWNHSHNHHSHNFVVHNNCFGFNCRNWGWGFPWWGWGWYDPWLSSSWDDEDRRFDEDYYRQYEMADRWNQQSLAEQRMRRQEEADGDQDAYAPRSSNQRSSNESVAQAAEPVAATVLVFRDRHQEEVSNYAIVGHTLWSFSAEKTKRIPLSDLDIAATEKANDDRGVNFRVPEVGEGQ